jgi:hypothetical protein
MRVGAGLLTLSLGLACGGQTTSSSDKRGRGGKSATTMPDDGQAGASEGGRGGVPDAIDGGPMPDDDPSGGAADMDPPIYDDPGCPDVEAPPGVVECDLFNEPSGCFADEGCYPYVAHPYGEGCEQQTFGAVCRPAGGGVQGSVCGDGSSGCAAGYACVVGTQSGKRCVKICDLNAPNACGDGLICGETDVEGVGVCA